MSRSGGSGTLLAAAGWAGVFAVPHLYWAFGGRGGLGADRAAADRAFDTVWFAAYNAVTALLCVVAVVLALRLVVRRPGPWAGRVLARLTLLAAVVLALRGAVGVTLLVVGLAQGQAWPPPVLVAVEPWFLLGGLVWWRVSVLLRSPGLRRTRSPR